MMKRFVCLALLLALFFAAGLSQDRFTSQSPKKVVAEYWAAESSGKRVSYTGWREARSFYASPGPYPSQREVMVIYGDSSIWEPRVKDDSAEVTVGVNIAGKVDSKLRFTSQKSTASKAGVSYHLVKQMANGENSSSEWKLDKPDPLFWLNVSSAISYVKSMRAHTNSPMLRRNADKSLTELAKYAHR
jgi:hypothetical protein